LAQDDHVFLISVLLQWQVGRTDFQRKARLSFQRGGYRKHQPNRLHGFRYAGAHDDFRTGILLKDGWNNQGFPVKRQIDGPCQNAKENESSEAHVSPSKYPSTKYFKRLALLTPTIPSGNPASRIHITETALCCRLDFLFEPHRPVAGFARRRA
jgi:hypothetical protein